MNHCVWTKTPKIGYEMHNNEDGGFTFTPIQYDEKLERDWCNECKKAVAEYRKEYYRIKDLRQNHLSKSHGHCFMCENCQPYTQDINDDAPLCRVDKCEICFLEIPTCIEKDGCPRNDTFEIRELGSEDEVD